MLIFCSETYNKQNELNVRFFAGRYGIPEDPATGSGNGCLAGYLVKHGYFEKASINLRVEQGYELGRPSLLLLKAERKGKAIAVDVGGKVKTVAKGMCVSIWFWRGLSLKSLDRTIYAFELFATTASLFQHALFSKILLRHAEKNAFPTASGHTYLLSKT